MNSKELLIFFILLSFSLVCAQAEPDLSYLDPNIPNCFHIAPSTTQTQLINIKQQVQAASFALDWRTSQSQMELILHSPDGYTIDRKNDTLPSLIHKKGDSFESYSISRPMPGNWKVEVISGDLPKEGEDYCLTAQVGETAKADAWFTKIIRDFLGVESESNRTPGDIAIAVGVDVLKAGNYSLKASIKDLKEGEEISLYKKAYLNLGSPEITVYLESPSSSGPYRVKDLILYNEYGDNIDAFSANYTTKEYDVVEQQISSARFNGNISDYSSDINSDGLYDFLTLDVGVNIQEPDNYSLMGSLYDTNHKQIVWSMGTAYLSAGDHTMHLDFDGKSIERQKVSGPYSLEELTLLAGSREEGVIMQDIRQQPYITKPYNYTQFIDPVWPEKVLSGSGSGELLLTIMVKSIIPAFRGRFSYDVVGVSMPPITSNWTWKGVTRGYAYDLPGVHMPAKPNNFTIKANGVKNLGVGVRKDPAKDGINHTRMWISSQAKANKDGIATIENDMISPGRYQFKIFGDAAENTSQVLLEMEVVKKLVINGSFNLSLETSGFPSGNYSLNAQAINGSFRFDEINLAGPSLGF